MATREKKSRQKAPEAAGPAADPAAGPAAESPPPAEPQPEPARGEEAEETDPLAVLSAEVAALNDQLLRALAETENVRRRGQRERDQAVKYAAAPLVRDLVEVADNLRRALESIPADRIEGDGPLRTLATGIEMTEAKLQSVFERHGIVKIDPLGERLDPHFHEAVFEIPDPEAAAGTVLQVVRAGYRLGDRLVRPAQVGVARGVPEAAAAEESEPGGADGGDAGGEDTSEEPSNPPGESGSSEDEPQSLGSRIDTTA